MDDNTSKEIDEKSLFIFGRDVSKIPCFRNSMLYGIGGGLVTGLAHFMFRSRPHAATSFAVYSFSGITIIYWLQCRYQYSKAKFEMQRLQVAMRKNAMYEGTSVDPTNDDGKTKT